MTSAIAARCRRYRQRRRAGMATVSVEIDLIRVSEFLIASNLLGAWDADDRHEVGRALAQLITVLIDRDFHT